MKKVFFVSLFVAVLSLSASAQKGEKAVGLNLGYGSEIKSPAIGVKFNYGITDQIRVSPSFNYFLEKDGLSGWEINADAHYLFNVAPKISVYPLAGLTFTGWTFDLGGIEALQGLPGLGSLNDESSSSTETRLGINIGAGIGYQLTDNIGIGLELKYSVISDFDQLVPMINFMYKF